MLLRYVHVRHAFPKHKKRPPFPNAFCPAPFTQSPHLRHVTLPSTWIYLVRPDQLDKIQTAGVQDDVVVSIQS